MDPNAPMVLAAARYADRDAAVADFKEIWDAKREGEFGHVAIAVLTKDEAGELQVERHDTTAKHLAWGGALLGAALCVVAPPAGVSAMATIGGMSGAGGLVGHLWHSVPKDKIRDASELLEAGQSGLIVVAIDHTSADLDGFFSRAEKSMCIDTTAGDLDEVFDRAIDDAQHVRAAT